jgi:hypothetical protein
MLVLSLAFRLPALGFRVHGPGLVHPFFFSCVTEFGAATGPSSLAAMADLKPRMLSPRETRAEFEVEDFSGWVSIYV